jgi:hypothetical protein
MPARNRRACAAAHPDLKTTIDGIREQSGSRGSRRDADRSTRTGDSQSMRLTFEHVIGALQPFTYVPELAALLPEVIARAASGDFGPLYAGAMLVTGDLDEQSNTALHYSVTCAEDVPRVTAADAASALSSAADEDARRARIVRLHRVAQRHRAGRRDDTRARATCRC